MIFRIFNRKYYGYFLNSTSLYKIRHIAVWVFNRRRTLLCNKYGISLGTNSQPNWLICAWVLGLESIESTHLTADQMRKDLQPQVENIISSRRVYWLGQPCKAGWQPPALGRWYCQAPTGWLELRPVRRPHPSHYSLHYFTTPLERPSPLVARRRHRPPLCSNVCTQTMSLQQILFYQLLIVLQISVSSAAIQFEVLSPEGRESPLEIITPNISMIYMPWKVLYYSSDVESRHYVGFQVWIWTPCYSTLEPEVRFVIGI